MNIVMMTNTFSPHVGGVARSIEAFRAQYLKLGHRVLVIAPTFDNVDPSGEADVVRVPSIEHFHGSDFSVALPIPGTVHTALEKFEPDIVHSHHPFLIGSKALRVAHTLGVPLIFTNHTRYEDYTHYLPGDSEALQRFVVNLATNYANLCDQVFAPSESIADLIKERGVTAPVAVVPTGVDFDRFSGGNGSAFRASLGIPDDAFVVGHLGRLAAEKNLNFLSEAIVLFLKESGDNRNTCCLLIGVGPYEQDIKDIFQQHGMADRLYMQGILDSTKVASAYAAMNVFAFASKSETQGMVLTEAMTSGVPVVALDASGVREVVNDGVNGRLLLDEDIESFVIALNWVKAQRASRMQCLIDGAYKTAQSFSIQRTADGALSHYNEAILRGMPNRHQEYSMWTRALHAIESEWAILRGFVGAAGAAISDKAT